MKKFLLYSLAVFLFGCSGPFEPADYVDPFIGTDGHGHTFPGATVPFGMVQLSPDTRIEGWDGCSGYHYTDNIIYGFSHTHLSGTGVGDYCDILFMPMTEKYTFYNGYKGNIDEGYGSRFDKDSEKASPGFYSVVLDDYDIKVDLTATKRVGFHKYDFPGNEQAFIIVDLAHRDEVLASSLRKVNDYEIEGMRRSRGWAKDQYVFFVARFSEPIEKFNIALNDTLISYGNETDGKNIKAALDFGVPESDEILVKVGISAVSIKGARKNLEAELADWDFERVKNEARSAWNKELSKIVVNSNKTNLKIFYTSLYHSMIAPNLFMDVDGKYRGTDLNIHQAEDFTNYTIFSLWDTYRATHPLYTIIDQKRTNNFIRTFIHHYQNGGQLPVWELAGNYTGCMIGYHSIPVIADAYRKGIRDYNADTVFKAMKHSAMQDHLGLESYKKYGFIPADQESESVSKTLEYAYDDWCIAQMAKELEREEDYKYYIQRAQSFKNVFDPETGFMRAKLFGAWKTPFDAAEVDFNYTEANSWQYSFYVPQDVTGLINLLGGEKAFENKLDSLFSVSPETKGRNQADITGLIGQYAHGNEPSHHMAYLYNYVGKSWKTQQRVHQIMKEMYSDQPDGLIGNEDCGQMSSWFVFSSMGFYPVTPASNIYIIGTPLLEESIINLENGNQFVMKAKGLSDKKYYIQSATLNGQPLNKSYITHEEIMGGGELVFTMGKEPNKEWGANEELPVSEIADHQILPVPYSTANGRSFDEQTTIELKSIVPNADIYYTTNGSKPTTQSFLYKEPITIRKTTTLKYFATKEGYPPSEVVELNLVKFPEGRSIILNKRPGSQYTGGTDSALIDGIYGKHDFRLGSWQGFQGVDLDVEIDLGKPTYITKLSANFLQDINSWIFMPSYVEFFVSSDGETYVPVGKAINDVPKEQWGVIVKEFSIYVYPKWTRYIKVIGKSDVMCPDWHKGKGNEMWIFADEISID